MLVATTSLNVTLFHSFCKQCHLSMYNTKLFYWTTIKNKHAANLPGHLRGKLRLNLGVHDQVFI